MLLGIILVLLGCVIAYAGFGLIGLIAIVIGLIVLVAPYVR